MRKNILTLLFIVPCSVFLMGGCGSKENKVIEPSPLVDQAAESKQASEELETTQ